jgi:hypothetical protein
MTYVRLGNVAARQGLRDGTGVEWTPIPGKRITTFSLGSLDDAMDDVIEGWYWHSSENPAWVESDNEELAESLASHWGCQISRPLNWEGDENEN